MSDRIEWELEKHTKHLSAISKSLYVLAELKFKDRNTLLRDHKEYFVKDMEEILDEIRKELDGPTASDTNYRRKD